MDGWSGGWRQGIPSSPMKDISNFLHQSITPKFLVACIDWIQIKVHRRSAFDFENDSIKTVPPSAGDPCGSSTSIYGGVLRRSAPVFSYRRTAAYPQTYPSRLNTLQARESTAGCWLDGSNRIWHGLPMFFKRKVAKAAAMRWQLLLVISTFLWSPSPIERTGSSSFSLLPRNET